MGHFLHNQNLLMLRDVMKCPTLAREFSIFHEIWILTYGLYVFLML